jgi:hypothetical protein
MQTALIILSIGISALLFGIGAWKCFTLYLTIQDRMRSRCEADARQEIRADVEECLRFVRGDEDPRLALRALQNLLDGGEFIQGSEFRAEYLRLKQCSG